MAAAHHSSTSLCFSANGVLSRARPEPEVSQPVEKLDMIEPGTGAETKSPELIPVIVKPHVVPASKSSLDCIERRAVERCRFESPPAKRCCAGLFMSLRAGAGTVVTARRAGATAMLTILPETRIFMATAPVDMCKSFDRLCAVVMEVLNKNPIDGHFFYFVARAAIVSKRFTGIATACASGTSAWKNAVTSGRAKSQRH